MSYFRSNIDQMEGYRPGEQPKEGDVVKLNTNENPYPPSPKVLEAVQGELNENLRKYPDPLCLEVRKRAAEIFDVSPEQIIVGNGSDDILTMIVRAFAGEGDLIVQPFPTYTLYQTLAQIQSARIVSVPFENLTELPTDIVQEGAKITFIANPNSPTGTAISTVDLEELAGKIDGVLVVDEAYVDFADANSLDLIKHKDNVLVLRSFSKSFSLASLRIGLGFGQEPLIEGLFKVKDSYNVNRISQAAAIAALDDIEYMHQMVGRVRETRESLAKTLGDLGLQVYSSQSNFLWVKCSTPTAGQIYAELKKRKVLVRYFSHPDIDDCLRITIGTPEEIEIFLAELKAILKKEMATA